MRQQPGVHFLVGRSCYKRLRALGVCRASSSVLGSAVKALVRRISTAAVSGLALIASAAVASHAIAAGPSSERAIARAINLKPSDIPGFSHGFNVVLRASPGQKTALG